MNKTISKLAGSEAAAKVCIIIAVLATLGAWLSAAANETTTLAVSVIIGCAALTPSLYSIMKGGEL